MTSATPPRRGAGGRAAIARIRRLFLIGHPRHELAQQSHSVLPKVPVCFCRLVDAVDPEASKVIAFAAACQKTNRPVEVHDGERPDVPLRPFPLAVNHDATTFEGPVPSAEGGRCGSSTISPDRICQERSRMVNRNAIQPRLLTRAIAPERKGKRRVPPKSPHSLC